MTHLIRTIIAVSIVVIVLAACSTAVGAPASQPPSPSQPAAPSEKPSEKPSVEPSEKPSVEPTEKPSVEPSEPAEEERVVAGKITVFPGTVSGPGGTIQEALDNPPSNDLPVLVNGVLFRDLDGRIYLATAVTDAAVPSFEEPMLEVLGLANDGPGWDMANAELLGLEEANGIVFNPNGQILGTLEIN